MKKKWNWNNPVTWKQCLLTGVFGMIVCSISVIIQTIDMKRMDKEFEAEMSMLHQSEESDDN